MSEQLPAEDALGFWLPIVVPCAAFSFTLMSSVSWWWSTASRPFLLGRTGWWVPMVFVTALSFLVGVFGSTTPDVEAALFTAMVTTMGFTGLWLLPPALSRNLIDTLSPNTSPADPA
ncbi:hypothetical protein [Streptomyces harbinensis]|uniref:Uncharacterized protein n=1 Tax=Streptomyces harbinensis TaxID=1176198 RepID=A0A1I6WB52_9ACTN|nr:hypothetical protein [Streptomyces harbinensis]SFT23237.1 hypothetical protein SAMN05444716_1175 [Streptomyces harbinensis]